MPNIKKGTPEIIEKVKELAKSNHNVLRIAKILGINRQTVANWVKEHNILVVKRIDPTTPKKEQDFIELIQSGKTITEARKTVGLPAQTAHNFVDKHKLRNFTRTRAQASLDKTLSLEEANKRLPQDSGTVIGYEQKLNKYIIKTEDNFIYYKSSAKLHQGDPRGKCGTKLTKDKVAIILLELGYELIPESFTIKRKALKAKHLTCGTIRENRLSNFKTQQCPYCSNNGTSAQELEVNDWVKSFGLNTEKYKFKERVTKPQEIDIYIPSLKIGIEYCGLYWHGEKSGKDKNYHYQKMLKAQEEGIQLITIFEHEWRDRNFQVKSFLRSKLNKNEIKLFARKTEVKEIKKEISAEFLDQYHIQGAPRIQIAFGLFNGDELISVITGSEHHRIKGQFTLNRLCFKENVSVIGGSSKLNKALCSWASQNGYNSVKTWSDNRWSIGNVYQAMGYKLEQELDPDYFYNDNGTIRSKQSCQKKNLLKRGAVGKTEREMALSLGYDRLWDCGKKAWTLNLL